MATPITTNGSDRRRVSGSPWQGIIDACDQAANQFSDPVAMEGINALDTAADAVEALANSFNNVGKNVTDTVYIDPKVISYFEELGQYVMGAVQPTRDGADAVKKAHQEDIDRIIENDPKKRKWDITVHDGMNVS